MEIERIAPERSVMIFVGTVIMAQWLGTMRAPTDESDDEAADRERYSDTDREIDVREEAT